MSNYNESSSEAYNIKEFILYSFIIQISIYCQFCHLHGCSFFINKFSPTIIEVTSIIGPVEDKRTILTWIKQSFPWR